MKKKTPSSIRSKHKKYESLEVDNITLEEHEIESYMEEIILNSPNKHNNNKNNHGSNSSMTAKKIHCGRFLGLFMMFLSAAFFLSMSTMISYLGRTNPDNLYPSTQLVFIRAIVCLILSAMWLRKEKESFLPEDTRTRNLLIYRSCIGVGGMLGNWFLISQLPFSDATVIVFSAPFWTMVMARLILKESFTKIDAVSLALGFLGVLLVARPGSSHETEEETPSGTARGIVVLIGICGAICSAGTNLLVRRLKHVHAMLTIFYLMIAASFGSIALAVINQDKFIFPANPTESILIIFISLFGFIGQLFKTEGLKRENAGPGAMMRLVYTYCLHTHTERSLKSSINTLHQNSY